MLRCTSYIRPLIIPWEAGSQCGQKFEIFASKPRFCADKNRVLKAEMWGHTRTKITKFAFGPKHAKMVVRAEKCDFLAQTCADKNWRIRKFGDLASKGIIRGPPISSVECECEHTIPLNLRASGYYMLASDVYMHRNGGKAAKTAWKKMPEVQILPASSPAGCGHRRCSGYKPRPPPTPHPRPTEVTDGRGALKDKRLDIGIR
ncbi:hypothetical protein FB451DRAFT_1177800 [Mycena latifolia]|nr:hypothetical protein FB451DRAFT_1177800 [Mycena latifolia]